MRILMVCLGNICRSPIAHGIMQKLIHEKGLSWYVDSAGTNGYHNGEAPDSRAIQCAMQHGVDLNSQRSRQVNFADLDNFDLILAMDNDNLNYLRKLAKTTEQINKIKLLMSYHNEDPEGIVPDPYYDNRFDLIFELIFAACSGVITRHAGL